MPLDGAPADAVAQMIRDELDLDGRPNLNLASFVGTYMEKEVNIPIRAKSVCSLTRPF